jgi:hypothetical protein
LIDTNSRVHLTGDWCIYPRFFDKAILLLSAEMQPQGFVIR